MAKIQKVAGIFRVNGVTLFLCKKLATKGLALWMVNKKRPTPDQYQAEFNKRSDAMFLSMKPKAISKEFATPEGAQEYIDLARLTTPKKEIRDLSIMINIPSEDSKGGIKRNKKTFKPIMTWALYDEHKDYRFLVQKLQAKVAT
tara:strand:- start:201 stop:632 length:432 start_codon:yes stop_codon:yes gene_type:complete